MAFPPEIWLMVIHALAQDGGKLASFATVSSLWQSVIEQYTFTRIRLTPSRIAELNAMTSRNRSRVRCLWLCLEVERYDCPTCNPEFEATYSTSTSEDTLIMTAFHDLFSVLSSWSRRSCLTLDISVYSISDSEYWFRYLTFEPDDLCDITASSQSAEQTAISGGMPHQHFWSAWSAFWRPDALEPVFSQIMGPKSLDEEEEEEEEEEQEAGYWRQLPLVTAVSRLLIRQQTRRRWKPRTLAEILARLPQLQEFHYEPWREWADDEQEDTDDNFIHLLECPAVKKLRSLTVFENFNPQYPRVFADNFCSPIRPPNHELGQALSRASLNLESVSGSFMVDANHFFDLDHHQTAPSWPHLTTLVLTSQILAQGQEQAVVMDMLQAAASAATRMPKLKTMIIWNGDEKLAAMFKYELISADQAPVITWRGTWELLLNSGIVQAWEAMALKHCGRRPRLVYEHLDNGTILSHGDAVVALGLPELVVRPISVYQIRQEQRFGQHQVDLDRWMSPGGLLPSHTESPWRRR